MKHHYDPHYNPENVRATCLIALIFIITAAIAAAATKLI